LMAAEIFRGPASSRNRHSGASANAHDFLHLLPISGPPSEGPSLMLVESVQRAREPE
jgi:hypothetical protein